MRILGNTSLVFGVDTFDTTSGWLAMELQYLSYECTIDTLQLLSLGPYASQHKHLKSKSIVLCFFTHAAIDHGYPTKTQQLRCPKFSA